MMFALLRLRLRTHRNRTPPPTPTSLALLASAPRLFLLTLWLAGTLPAASAFAAPNPSPATASVMAARETTAGPHALRTLVQEACIASQTELLDCNGIVWLEHLNLVVGSMSLAKKFYVDFLGLSQDDNPKHVNLGQQQFHLAANGAPQRVTGSIGLTVPSVRRIRDRVGRARAELEGTLFAVLAEDAETMSVTCPWGNILHLYDISLDERSSGEAPRASPRKMVTLHREGGAYGAHRMAVRGRPGIRFVEFACRTGTAGAIARFYERMLGCHVRRSAVPRGADARGAGGAAVACVAVGPGVHFAFVERPCATDAARARMEGVHACVYVSHFRRTYAALAGRDLVWTNPRFAHLDSCESWEEARASRTLRFKDVVDLNTGQKVLELEHETRPMLHGQYMKVPPYTAN